VKVACVVPALDAAAPLKGVLSGIRAAIPAALIVVIDDGSSDETSSVAGSGADVVVRHERTRGKGAALRVGVAIALEKGATVVATIDGDGQHDPAMLPTLVAGTRDADIVTGCRRRAGTTMPPQRRLSNWMSSRVVSTLAGCRINDSQCGFRAIRREVLERVSARGDRYEYETELLVGAARAGFRIASVAIPTLYAPNGRSHFRSLRDTSRVAFAMLRLALTPAR
jgi:glycosyltransferase involved in cell wall biosynthesis